jgi:hypothetical protein
MVSVAIALLVVAAGVGLAMKFKIAALIAASFLLAVLTGAVWNYQSWPWGEGLARVLGLVGLLQVSYLLGLGLAHLTRRLRRRPVGDGRGRGAHGANAEGSHRGVVRTFRPSA